MAILYVVESATTEKTRQEHSMQEQQIMKDLEAILICEQNSLSNKQLKAFYETTVKLITWSLKEVLKNIKMQLKKSMV